MYDEVKYWGKRSWPNSRNQEGFPEALAFAKKCTNGARKILDYGPGVGRMFPAFADAEEVTGYDITDKWLKELETAASKYTFKFIPVISTAIMAFPFSDNTFDVAIAQSILMHIRPENIEFVMYELSRVAKFVGVGTYYAPDRDYDVETDDKHMYNHNYPAILKRNGMKYTHDSVIKKYRTHFFIYWREHAI